MHLPKAPKPFCRQRNDDILLAEANENSRIGLFIQLLANLKIPLDPKEQLGSPCSQKVGVGIFPNKPQAHEGRDWVFGFATL